MKTSTWHILPSSGTFQIGKCPNWHFVGLTLTWMCEIYNKVKLKMWCKGCIPLQCNNSRSKKSHKDEKSRDEKDFWVWSTLCGRILWKHLINKHFILHKKRPGENSEQFRVVHAAERTTPLSPTHTSQLYIKHHSLLPSSLSTSLVRS